MGGGRGEVRFRLVTETPSRSAWVRATRTDGVVVHSSLLRRRSRNAMGVILEYSFEIPCVEPIRTDLLTMHIRRVCRK